MRDKGIDPLQVTGDDIRLYAAACNRRARTGDYVNVSVRESLDCFSNQALPIPVTK